MAEEIEVRVYRRETFVKLHVLAEGGGYLLIYLFFLKVPLQLLAP